jgi:hypothetical protein
MRPTRDAAIAVYQTSPPGPAVIADGWLMPALNSLMVAAAALPAAHTDVAAAARSAIAQVRHELVAPRRARA